MAGAKKKDSDQEKQTQAAQQPTPEVNTDFMTEEIRRRPVNRRKLVRRTLSTVVMAVIFGAVACLVFLLLEPVINSYLNPAEEPAEVSFAEEVVAAEEEIAPEDMIADDQEIQAAAAEEIAASSVDAITQEVLGEVQKQLEEEAAAEEAAAAAAAEEEENTSFDTAAFYEGIETSLTEIAEKVQCAMVTVTAINSDYDWVGDAFSSSDSVSGLIVAERGDNLLILADDEDLTGAEEISVTFHDGQTAAAEPVCSDPILDLVILAVAEGDLDAPPEENDDIAVCTLGSSASSGETGSFVVAVGSPTGTQGSVNYGIITNRDIALDVTDSALRQITTDIYGSTAATGVLVNEEAEVIGWIDMDHNGSDSPNLISAIGITELKDLIENMSNEVSAGYLGIHGTDVPENISAEQGIPEGAYVLKTEMDSPAMEGGIQAGDIITSLNGNVITSCGDVVEVLSGTLSGRYLSVTVMRAAQDEYEEVDLTVQLGERFTLYGE